MRKILFFDIDNTIWNYRNEIPESTVTAIRQARANGHLAFLCTGRGRGYVRHPDLLGIGFDGIVSGCGTMIEYQGETIFYKQLDNGFLEQTILTLKDCGCRTILEGRRHLYLDYEDFADDWYGQKVIREMGEDLRSLTGEWGRWEVSKFACATENADRERLFAALSPDYDFLIHNTAVAEIVPKGFSKATGMEAVCSHLGADLTDAVAFGDSENDRSMLQKAGFSVVMGNGAEPIKRLADLVTAPMEEDGIYHACRTLGLI